MATSSITKRFVIKDDAACDRLIEALNKKNTHEKSTSSKRYDEGKKILKQYYTH